MATPPGWQQSEVGKGRLFAKLVASDASKSSASEDVFGIRTLAVNTDVSEPSSQGMDVDDTEAEEASFGGFAQIARTQLQEMAIEAFDLPTPVLSTAESPSTSLPFQNRLSLQNRPTSASTSRSPPQL